MHGHVSFVFRRKLCHQVSHINIAIGMTFIYTINGLNRLFRVRMLQVYSCHYICNYIFARWLNIVNLIQIGFAIDIWAALLENQRFAYAKTKTQISFAVKISAFVFATWIVHYLYFLYPKFQASSNLQWLYSLICVRPGQNPHSWFSHVAVH